MNCKKGTKVRSTKWMSLLVLIGLLLIGPENAASDWIHYLEVGLEAADWTLVGEEKGDWTGYFASPAGDVNGDGLGDVLIGAPMAGEKECPYPLEPDGSCPALPKGQGVAYLVLGRSGEMTPDPLNLEEADASFLGCEINSMTARQLYTAGDVNGDGFDDILISGWKCGENYTGKAYLFLGRSDVDTWGRYFPVEDADASFLGENEWDFLSYYTATAGDVNADGYDDILITATHHEYDEPCQPGISIECTTCCKNFLNSAEIYDSSTDTWTITNSLSIERIKHTAVLFNDGVLVAGGQNKDQYLNSTELFNSLTGSWEQTGNLNIARSGHSMTRLANSSVIVAGGQNSAGFLGSTELFVPETRTWIITGSMLSARSGHTMIQLSNGKVLATGGQNADGFLASAELFDPATGLWATTGSMNTARSGHTMTLLINGKVLITGGQNAEGYLDSAEIFNPETGSWKSTGRMDSSRSKHTATILPDGDVLVVGGKNETEILYSSEIYKTKTETWITTELLNEGRYSHTAELLPDGDVMVVGGQDLGGSLFSYEFYEPGSDTWTSIITHTLNTARADHISLTLPDGKILTAGGRECTDFGKTYLILGRQLADWGTDFPLAQADASFIGENANDRLGRSTHGVGDVNGDGYGDFLIGAISSDYTAFDAGQNYLFLGRATAADAGYNPLRPWWGNNYSVARADASFVGEAAGDETGRRVGGAGDTNGDGLDDMLMQSARNDYAAKDAGITYLVLGRQAADWGMHYPLANADASFVGENQHDQSGRRMSGVGDVNNDGYDDFLTGAPHNNDGSEFLNIFAGKAYLIYGRPDTDWGTYYSLSRADIIYVGKPEIGVAGYDMAGLGDFNGDGIDDYLIAAYGGRNNDHVPGEVYILKGSGTPIPVQFLTNYVEIDNYPLLRYGGEFWEPNGWKDIHFTELYLQEEGGSIGLNLKYDHSLNLMYLFDPQTTTWLGPCTPGTNGLLLNNAAQLDCRGSRILIDDNHTMRVAWLIRWLQTTENRVFHVYLRCDDYSGNNSDWIYFNTWSLQVHDVFLPVITR